jgi:hypothetical protein
VIVSVVMLTLLLAPEAYTGFGLAFALLILAGLVAEAAGRSSKRTKLLLETTQ